jgi:hypothetical protein
MCTGPLADAMTCITNIENIYSIYPIQDGTRILAQAFSFSLTSSNIQKITIKLKFNPVETPWDQMGRDR